MKSPSPLSQSSKGTAVQAGSKRWWEINTIRAELTPHPPLEVLFQGLKCEGSGLHSHKATWSRNVGVHREGLRQQIILYAAIPLTLLLCFNYRVLFRKTK